MLEKFKSILQNDYDNFHGKQLFLAISGGKDSVCLSHLLLAAGFQHSLLHCNFQLRDEDSNLDEDFIREYANNNNLPFQSIKFDTAKIANDKKLTIQETARNLRYHWFNTFLKNTEDILLTAHHSDDSIETFFINLMRGTSLKGLTGINNNGKNVARPLLAFSTSEIEDYIETNNLKYRQDQSNYDNKYLRNYLRNQVIPAIQEKSENFKPKVAKTIQSLKEADNWIEEQATNFYKKNSQQINGALTFDKNLIINQDIFFLTYLFKSFGIQRSNVESFKTAISQSTGAKFLTASYQFSVNRDQILITENMNNKNESEPNALNITHTTIDSFPCKLEIKNLQLQFSVLENHLPFSNNSIQQFDLSKIERPLTVRLWKHGDRIQPLGMIGTKLISDVLIDKKVPLTNKAEIFVIIDSNKSIISIPGILISEKVKILPTTKNILALNFSKPS